MTALEWLLNRTLDVTIASGELPPASVSGFGVALIVAAVVVLGWLWRRARANKRAERCRPAPGNLLVEDGWLAEEGPEVPGYRYRGKRRAPRKPVVPAHPEVAATQLIARVTDDPEATAVLTRPRGRWGSR